jgi:hypothetical protein
LRNLQDRICLFHIPHISHKADAVPNNIYILRLMSDGRVIRFLLDQLLALHQDVFHLKNDASGVPLLTRITRLGSLLDYCPLFVL